VSQPEATAHLGDRQADPRIGERLQLTSSKRRDARTTAGASLHDKLRPGGVFAQWIQLYRLSPDLLKSTVATDTAVLPHAIGFQTAAADLMLVGSVEPLPADYPTLAARLARPGVATGLRRMRIRDVGDLAQYRGQRPRRVRTTSHPRRRRRSRRPGCRRRRAGRRRLLADRGPGHGSGRGPGQPGLSGPPAAETPPDRRALRGGWYPESVPFEPTWIRTPDEAHALAQELVGVAAVAIDTEADSLHHYPERLCLVQVADPAGRVYLVDALALPDLEAFRAICADRATFKVLHSADNDLAHLKRRFGLKFEGLDDTLLAARFLGVRELGLERLLAQYLGIQAVKSQQKTDWARRPLTAAQKAYAADDVRHLIPLRDRLLEEIRAVGREAWYREECAAVAALPAPERAPDENGYRRIRGAGRLDHRGLSVLRAVHVQRESWALGERRPPFKVLSPETLLALAVQVPRERGDLGRIPGLPPRLVERYGDGILAAISRGLAEPVGEPPRPPRRPQPAPPALLRARADALRRCRAQAAERTGLDPGFLLPQRLIDALAAAPPPDVARLAAVPGFRRWRAESLGIEILEALASAKGS